MSAGVEVEEKEEKQEEDVTFGRIYWTFLHRILAKRLYERAL